VPVHTVPVRVDAILLSHLHLDHLHAPSIRSLSPGAPVIVPRGTGRSSTVRSLRRRVEELAVGDSIDVAGATVEAVPAVHDGRRFPVGPSVPAVGFVIHASGRSVYFAGDTDLYDGMAALGGRVDVALLPVWGWGTNLGPGHMDPEQAALAAALIRPALAIPIHWGTYLPIGATRRHAALLHTPGAEFAERLADLAPGVRARVLAPGDSLSFGSGELS
jgi:L-ascorbate metabolism protein UlaG (beta-lactamase superfamily)